MNHKQNQHHTIADWDFTTNTPYTLIDYLYISPPTSLRLWGGLVPLINAAILCRIGDTLCLPQGEVRTWHRTTNRVWSFFLIFRNQHPLGGADLDNTYFWSLTGDWATLARHINGVPVMIDSFRIYYPNDTWSHWRCRYFHGQNLAHEPALVCELYKEVAGEWELQGEPLYDTQNEWQDSDINRSGIGATVNGTWHQYFDDTEIWGLV